MLLGPISYQILCALLNGRFFENVHVKRIGTVVFPVNKVYISNTCIMIYFNENYIKEKRLQNNFTLKGTALSFP